MSKYSGMDGIEELLSYLAQDYRSHSLDEISKELGMEEEKIELITRFLASYDFIKFNSTQVKIDEGLKELYLMDNLQETSQEMPYGSINR